MTLLKGSIDFTLPESSIGTGPAEQRGSARDDVRLMVARRSTGSVEHERFAQLDHHLLGGDVVVVNTSATIPAAIDAWSSSGKMFKIHFASPASGGLWTLEVRTPTKDGGTLPGSGSEPQTLELAGGAHAHLLARSPRSPRLWVAAIEGAGNLVSYLEIHGHPIRYVPGPAWPLADYQTVFATEPGSAEMPSAARPFTTRMVTRLVSMGVAVVPLVLHAGVSSYEEDEAPGEERYEVPAATATVVNALRSSGGRVIAVGTTVVRALETVADESGRVHPGQGLTELIVTADRGVRAVDGLLTGWHEPRSSHLKMLEAFSSRDDLQAIYDQALSTGYLWHEFGDMLLIL